MVRVLISAAVVVVTLSVAHGADLEGVSMPDARMVDGIQMRLNGMGLRTYSVLGIRIYVAGLYLERRSGDPNTILHSQQRKLLDIRFCVMLVQRCPKGMAGELRAKLQGAVLPRSSRLATVSHGGSIDAQGR